jgi:hypothetical protein
LACGCASEAGFENRGMEMPRLNIIHGAAWSALCRPFLVLLTFFDCAFAFPFILPQRSFFLIDTEALCRLLNAPISELFAYRPCCWLTP